MADVGGWDFAGQPAVTGTGMITLVEGSSFCVCQSNGDITSGGTQGLYFCDTRILSSWRLTIDDRAPEPLVVMEPHSFEARFLSRATPPPESSESAILVERHRLVGVGMREEIIVRNLSSVTLSMSLLLTLDADFADLFAVKESRVEPGRQAVRTPTPRGLMLSHRDASNGRGVLVRGRGWTADAESASLRARVELPPRATWTSSIAACPIVDGEELTPLFGADSDMAESHGSQRLSRWTQSVPIVNVAHPGLAATLRASIRDLGALRIFDSADPELPAVAAGAPWFMTLFGRDSLISSYLALLFDQDLALGTLRMLARQQGSRVDESSEEQPGRILHEMRSGADLELALGGGGTYYGTADATPLFVVLLGELSRWGLPLEQVEALLPHADRALDWIREYGDRDHDGFVEYERTTERGLSNQGWKDSWDGVNFADGRLAETPIALAEVQGYVYAAFRARAGLARRLNDPTTAADCSAVAADLKARFNEAFWMPEHGYYAIALDRHKNPVDGLASNMGHCLWSGVVAEEHAADVVTRLMADDMFSGWGIRTLSTEMARYNPMSYHNGSVWPHDNALIVGGLSRYGFRPQAQQLSRALLEAAEPFAGRLPELFCGFPRGAFPEPVPYPTSCSPQAWAAATPVHLLRTMLGMQPDVPAGRLELAPDLPAEFGQVTLANLPLSRLRLELAATCRDVAVSGLPADLSVVRETPTDPLGGSNT